MSSIDTIPSGLYATAFHKHFFISSILPSTNISLASFKSQLTTLTLPGSNKLTHSLAAACPASSLSNPITTSLKADNHSMLCRKDSTEDCAPLGIDTEGNCVA